VHPRIDASLAELDDEDRPKARFVEATVLPRREPQPLLVGLFPGALRVWRANSARPDDRSFRPSEHPAYDSFRHQ
jgi:hypothetical protein